MKTGATIHTMNGLNMYPRKISADAAPPKTMGYWENQHLKRGLKADGMPFNVAEEDAAKVASHRKVDPGSSGGGSPLV